MDRAALAKARHRLWGLLGRILADGADASLDRQIRALPALAPHLLPDPDERLAEHQRVFGWEVHAWESVFRDPDGHLGGQIAHEVQTAYAGGGFRPGRTDLQPDHVGLELAFLAHLAAAEHEALVDGQLNRADHVLDLQRRFLVEHVLRWLPMLVIAVRRVSSGLEATACELALELAASLVDDTGPAPEPTPDLLDDPSTGIARVARHLCCPASSGWWLGHATLAAIAKVAGVPSGFERRARRLESILFAAVDHGCLEPLVAAMSAECARWKAELGALGDLGVDVSEPLTRLDTTRALLERLGLATSVEEAWTP